MFDTNTKKNKTLKKEELLRRENSESFLFLTFPSLSVPHVELKAGAHSVELILVCLC